MTNSPDFVRQGLPTKTETAARIWRLSRILNRSPFDPYILNHNAAQADFILEKYLEDHPGEYQFTRPGKEEEEDIPKDIRAKTRWAEIVIGKAAAAFWKPLLPSAAVMERLRRMAPQPPSPSPGPSAPGPGANIRQFPLPKGNRPPKRPMS